MISIDGSLGEGGGQVLRTSLSLSLLTGQPFSIEKIRAGRPKPGLMRQHLAAVAAAAEISGAGVFGQELGSTSVRFSPGKVQPGSYRFDVGSAGSCTLVLQTVLPALLDASAPSDLVLAGGTHNPLAPPFDFLEKAFLPLLTRMGAVVSATLVRPGFYPAGGGEILVRVEPAGKLSPLLVCERGEIRCRLARACVAGLPRHIAEREAKTVAKSLSWGPGCLKVEELVGSRGPGNVVVLEIESSQVTEVFTGFGEKGVPAERVATNVAGQVREYLAAGVPVGCHLADQLLLPLAMAGAGRFRTLPPTRHTATNIEVIRKFLPVEFLVEEVSAEAVEVEVRRA